MSAVNLSMNKQTSEIWVRYNMECDNSYMNPKLKTSMLSANHGMKFLQISAYTLKGMALVK